MKTEDFEQRLSERVLIADGAMGSLLYDSLGPHRAIEELNSASPEAVFRVHTAYLDACAQIIETNTFGANRHKLAAIGLGDRVIELNHRGVKIAREARDAAKHEVLIAGSIGPLGARRGLQPLQPEQIREMFREQSGALEERGVDLFILETFSDLDELTSAIDAIRSFSRLPVIAQLTYSDEGTTFGGVHPASAWSVLHAKNVQVIGANCATGPQFILQILQELSAAANGGFLSAMPNAGFPMRIGDRTVYPKSSPEYFAEFAREAAALGARVIGGCCGTTPAHIRAMAEVVKELKPGSGVHVSAASSVAVDKSRPITKEPESRLWKKIQARKFVVSIEIDPPKGIAIDRVAEQVNRLTESGHVDVVNITSGPLARVGMDALMFAGALEARGCETIPHLTTRDSNTIGLQAALLGAWSVGGIRNVLAITGDPPSISDHPETAGVYEVDAIGLVKILSRLNQGMDWSGKNLGGATNFTIGVAVNPVAEDMDTELRRFAAKIEAGAHFAMTQPIFDPNHWEIFLKQLGGKPPIPVLVGLWPLTSYKQAVRLDNEVPGIVIPTDVLKQLEAAGNNARDRGFAIAKEMLHWAAHARNLGIAGTYLVPPFKRYEEILEIF